MWLAETSIKRPVFATMFIVALVVLGFVSYPEIGVDLFPKVDFPIVSINTQLKGASPEIMDIDVTDKIEEAISTINGVKTITSSSLESVSNVVVEFVLERNIDLAVQDVREKVSAIRSKLPTDVLEPVIQKVDPDATPVLWLIVTGPRSIRDLSTYTDEVLKVQLQRIDGVGALRIAGTRLRQGRIWLEAYPRFQGDAANFHHAIFIITAQGMSPYALRLVQPNGKDYTVYGFFNIVVNDKLRIFQGDPFRPFTPFGWQMIPDDLPPPAQSGPPQARRPPSDARR